MVDNNAHGTQQALTTSRASHSPPQFWGSLQQTLNTQSQPRRSLGQTCGQCSAGGGGAQMRVCQYATQQVNNVVGNRSSGAHDRLAHTQLCGSHSGTGMNWLGTQQPTIYRIWVQLQGLLNTSQLEASRSLPASIQLASGRQLTPHHTTVLIYQSPLHARKNGR